MKNAQGRNMGGFTKKAIVVAMSSGMAALVAQYALADTRINPFLPSITDNGTSALSDYALQTTTGTPPSATANVSGDLKYIVGQVPIVGPPAGFALDYNPITWQFGPIVVAGANLDNNLTEAYASINAANFSPASPLPNPPGGPDDPEVDIDPNGLVVGSLDVGSAQVANGGDVVATVDAGLFDIDLRPGIYVDNQQVSTEMLAVVDVSASSGASVSVSGNRISARGHTNVAYNDLVGDLDPNFSNANVNFVRMWPDVSQVRARGSLVVNGTQVARNDGADPQVGTATIREGTRIGAEVVGGADALRLDVDNNTLNAEYSANLLGNRIAIDDDDGANALEGSAVASSYQQDVSTGTRTAQVYRSFIEAGDSEGLYVEVGAPGGADNIPSGSPQAISDLTGASRASVSGNTVAADAASNVVSNQISLDGLGVNEQLPVGSGVPSSRYTLADTRFEVGSTIAIGSRQDSTASVTSQLGGDDPADPAATPDISTGVNALFSATSADTAIRINENTLRSSASGNSARHEIDVLGEEDISGFINTLSLQRNIAGSLTANNEASVRVDLGFDDNDNIGGIVRVDDNVSSTIAVANEVDSSIELDASTIDRHGSVNAIASTFQYRDNFSIETNSYVATTAIQYAEDVTSSADVDSSVVVRMDTVDGDVDISSARVNRNSVSGAAYGNLNRRSSVDATTDGGDIDSTFAAGNFQTLEGANINATVSGSDSDDLATSNVIEVVMSGNSVGSADSTARVNENRIFAGAYGNVAMENRVSVDAGDGSVTDDTADNGNQGNTIFRYSGVPDVHSLATGALTVSNDQDAGDLAAPLLATVNNAGPAIVFEVGGVATEAVNGNYRLNQNTVMAEAQLTRSTNSIDLNAGSLDGSITVGNHQSLDDENDDGESGSVQASANQTLLLSVEKTTTDLLAGTFRADENIVGSRAGVNDATNSIDVDVETNQNLSGTAAPDDTTTPAVEEDYSAVILAGSGIVLTRELGEIGIGSDQLVENLADGGVTSTVTDGGVDVEVDSGGGDFNGRLSANGNTISSDVGGNRALNSIAASVDGAINLEEAIGENQDPDNEPGNAPYITIASDQTAVTAGNGSFVSRTDDSNVSVNLSNTQDVTDGSRIEVDDNRITNSGIVNYVENSVESEAGSLVNPEFNLQNPNPVAVPEMEFASDNSNSLIARNSIISVGSRQVNEYDVNLTNQGLTGASLITDDDLVSIDPSRVSVSGNTTTLNAAGNVATNSALVDIGTNHSLTQVGNLQINSLPDGSVAIEAESEDDADGMAHFALDGSSAALIDSRADVDRNRMIVQARGNVADNDVDILGDNIYSGYSVTSGGARMSPLIAVDAAGPLWLDMTADHSLGSYQDVGATSTVALASETYIGFTFDELISAVVSADENGIFALSALNEADSTLAIGDEDTLNVGADAGNNSDEEVSGALANVQRAGAGSASATVESAVIGTASSDTTVDGAGEINVGPIDAFDNPLIGPTGSRISVSDNEVAAIARGNYVSPSFEDPDDPDARLGNQLLVDGNAVLGQQVGVTATIDGALGTIDTSADFSLVNDQQSAADVRATIRTAQADNQSLGGNSIGVVGTSALNQDVVRVDDNTFLALAQGQVAGNRLAIGPTSDLLDDEEGIGTSIESTQQLVSNQVSTAADIDAEVLLGRTSTSIIVDTDGAINSRVTLQGDQVVAGAYSNTVNNRLELLAGTTIVGSGAAPAAEVPALGALDVAPNVLAASADNLLLSRQEVSDGSTQANVQAVQIAANLDGAITGSNVDIGGAGEDGNLVQAAATGNLGTNVLSLEAGTTVGQGQTAATSALVSVQDLDPSPVDVDINGVLQGIIGTASSDSALTVTNADVQGTAYANRVQNQSTITAGTAIVGSTIGRVAVDSTGNIAVNGPPVGNDRVDPVSADHLLLNSQRTLDSPVTSDVTAVGTAVSLDSSLRDNIDLTDSDVIASATANDASSRLALEAGTAVGSPAAAVTASSALVNAQVNQVGQPAGGGNISADINTALIQVVAYTPVPGVAELTDSDVDLRDNTIGAVAASNRATNLLTVDSGTGMAANGQAAPVLAIDIAGSDGYDLEINVPDGTGIVADATVLNLQNNIDVDGIPVSHNATVTNSSIMVGADGIGDASAVSVVDNTMSAAVAGNDAQSALYRDAGTAVDATSAVASYQLNEHSVLAGIVPTPSPTPEIGILSTETVDASNLDVAGNTVSAQAYANRAQTALGIEAGTAVNGQVVSPSTTTAALAHIGQGNPAVANSFNTPVVADATVANAQVSGGQEQAVNVRADIDATQVGVEIRDNFNAAAVNEALIASDVDLDNNAVDATAFGNYAETSLAIVTGTLSDFAASLASLQVSDNMAVASTLEQIEVMVDVAGATNVAGGVLGITNSNVTVDENLVNLRATNNYAVNDLDIEAGTGAQFVSGTQQTSVQPVDTMRVRSTQGATLVNSQYGTQTARADGDNTINGARVGINATDTDVQGAVVGRPVVNSALEVADNTVAALYEVNAANNSLAVEAGTAVADAAALGSETALVNAQMAYDTTQDTRVNGAVVGVTAGTISNSGARVNMNDVQSVSRANMAVNSVEITSGTAIEGSGTSTTTIASYEGPGVSGNALIYAPDAVPTDPNLLVVGDISTDSDNVLANYQQFNGVNLQTPSGYARATAINVSVGVGVLGGITPASVVEVNDNRVQSSASGNVALNEFEVTAGTHVELDAAIANYQQSTLFSATGPQGIAATTSNVRVASTQTLGVAESVIDVSRNVVSGSAALNSASNELTATAGGALNPQPGAVPPSNSQVYDAVSQYPGMLDNTLSNNADASVTSLQGALGGRVEVDVSGVGVGALGTTTGYSGSVVTVNDNTVAATGSGNSVENEIALNSGHDLASTASIVTTQRFVENGRADGVFVELTDATVRVETSDADADPADVAAADSNIEIEGNRLSAIATNNASVNNIALDAGHEYVPAAGATTFAGFVAVDYNQSSTAQVSILNLQQSENVDVEATTRNVTVMASLDGTVNDSRVSVSGNVIEAVAVANDASNRLTFAGSGLDGTPTGSIASSQIASGSNVNATVTGTGIGVSGITGAANSTVTVSGNVTRAVAVVNSSSSHIGPGE